MLKYMLNTYMLSKRYIFIIAYWIYGKKYYFKNIISLHIDLSCVLLILSTLPAGEYDAIDYVIPTYIFV